MTFINKQYEAYLAYLKTLETFLVNKKQGNINPAKTHMYRSEYMYHSNWYIIYVTSNVLQWIYVSQ